MGRVRLRVDERRDQLIALGARLFDERSFDAISIDDIAASAGISKGLLYHYFPGKRQFYAAVVRASIADLQAATDTPAEMAPRERMVTGLDAYLRYVEDHAHGYATLMRAGVGADPQIAQIVEDSRLVFIDRLLEGLPVPAPGAPSPALRVALRGWVGFVEGASAEWAERRTVPRERMVALLLDVFAGILQAAAAADPGLTLDAY